MSFTIPGTDHRIDLKRFTFDGPAIFGVSGGRTSALLLWLSLQAYGGKLPVDHVPLFCNTGDEMPETYAFVAACAKRWGVDIAWAERTKGGDFREVFPETASRHGEPFAQLIDDRGGYLPHTGARFCTAELKMGVTEDYAATLGFEDWFNVVGLRADEPLRVAKKRAENNVREGLVERVAQMALPGFPGKRRKVVVERPYINAMPLYDAGITKPVVAAFWAHMKATEGFDLGLEWWESNCRGCFLKGAAIRERIERDHPGSLAWWVEQESRTGATFIKGRRYLSVVKAARRPGLVPDLAPEDAVLPCACTDRKTPRVKRCSCGARRGQAHKLSCVRFATWIDLSA